MTRGKKQKERKIIKVVYFDEQAARDYLDIVNGGRLDWSTVSDGTNTVMKNNLPFDIL